MPSLSLSTFGGKELFSQEAHLFLVRLTSWFSVTLPLLYELPLQLYGVPLRFGVPTGGDGMV